MSDLWSKGFTYINKRWGPFPLGNKTQLYKWIPAHRLCRGVLQLDNFRKLQGFGWPGFKRMNLLRQDKGQKACTAAFLEAWNEHFGR